jgi:hypothetical protein
VEGSRRNLLATTVAAAVAASLVAGCGGGMRQDANEPTGTFKVDVVKASFPKQQRIAKATTMRITVRNADTRTIPDVAVSVLSEDPTGGGGFNTRSDQPGLADPTRQLWIVDKGPSGGDTAYVSTWALGALPAGQSRTFEWHVTPVVAGSHTLRWRVAAGLNGNARAQTEGGQAATGTFPVTVSSKPAAVTVDPKTGDVVEADDAAPSSS